MAFLDIAALLPSTLTQHETTRCKLALEGLNLAVSRNIQWAQVFKNLGWPHDSALICDNNTWLALGQKLAQILESEGYRITLINLGTAPHPSMESVRYICEQTTNCKAFIAVGSGTINDLTKYSAHQMRKPYAICGTAPSMNGYLSANAAITEHGHKQSLKAALPCAALFDLDIVHAAPDRLRQAGIGDSICRPTAQADWLLSHHLLGTPYNPLPFKLLQPFEDGMLKGKTEALITTLLLSGLGMTLCDGSYPASQGEHLISHYLEMRYPQVAEHSFHGEQIAVTTLFMSNLQHGLLSLKVAPQWQDTPLPTKSYCLEHFGKETGESVWKEWQAKLEAMGSRKDFNERLAKNWTEICEAINPIALPVATIDRALAKAEAPRSAQVLGVDKAQFTDAVHHAHLIRNRFTFLDLSMLAKT